MIVLLREGADPGQARAVEAALQRAGATARRVASPSGAGRVALEVVGPHAPLDEATLEQLEALAGVEAVLRPADPCPRVSAERGPVAVGDALVGDGALLLALGPCSVDDEEDLERIAVAARAAGARLLRGGAFKPRSSPYAFQGLGSEGLELLRRVADRHGLGVVTEVMSEAAVDEVAASAELLQIGARSMSSTPLLRAAGRAGRPVLLKRGFGATVDEWLLAAEYLYDAGAPGVILCERGIRSFEPGTRATLDVGGLALARLRTRLPVLADPSHAAGTHKLVQPLALAAVAAGADGLIVECHPDPGRARSDGPQALTLEELPAFARAVADVARAVGKRVEVCSPLWTETGPRTTARSRPQSSASPR